MEDAENKITDLRFRYVEQARVPPSHEVQTLRGEVFVKRPSHLRVEQNKPDRQVVWTDGQKAWIYQPALRQVLVGDWKKWTRDQTFPNFAFPLADRLSEWRERYHLRLGEQSEGAYLLILKPQDHEGPLEMTVWVSAETFFPFKTKLAYPTYELTLTVEDMRVNAGFPDHLFVLDVPKGTEIVPIPF